MNDYVMQTVIGHVDGAVDGLVSGWAADSSLPGHRIILQVLHDGVRICTFRADEFRQDLLEAGIGDGRHGFAVRLPMDLFLMPAISVQVTTLQGGLELVNSPVMVRNPSVLAAGSTLDAFGKSIRRAIEAAGSGNDLQALSAWLIEHFDMVYQRQASLNAAQSVSRKGFADLVANNGGLSDMLKKAADAVVAGFPPVSLPETTSPDVSIVVPAFGQFALTHSCLQSIADSLPKASIEVILVDDASIDETVYAALVLSGGIRIIRNSRNMGYVESTLTGVRAARGRFLMFLNNDTTVQDGWLDELLDTFERDSNIGIVGSKLLYPNGTLQEVGGIVWRQGTGCNWGRHADPDDPRFCFLRDVDYVSGASLLIRRAVYDDVGGLSPEFAPGYYEDTDLCFKVRAAGFRVVVQPHSRIVHHEGASAGTDVSSAGMKRYQRINHRLFLQKWFDVLQDHYLSESDALRASERQVRQRVLFIDDTVPTPDRDAGSIAALEHMKSLQRLGFKVHFVGADNLAKISPYTEALERIGIQNYYAPYFWSVEEILRRESVKFDLIYIHRMMNVVKYAPVIRQRFPNVRVVLNVADLHHLRLEREAALLDDASIRDRAGRAKDAELAAIAEVDSVIVHSIHEKEVLSHIAPVARVHVVPWVVRPKRIPLPFRVRSGIAFVGGYNHTPNVDAALWLINEIMPLVHSASPEIECHLIGSQMPESIVKLERPGVRIIGHTSDLMSALASLRLTVAPLRFGAGLKGKVLSSLALGLPCVSTPCAVEGMGWPDDLTALVADGPEDFARAIVEFHSVETRNHMLAEAGLRFVEQRFSEPVIDDLVRDAISDVPRLVRAQTGTMEEGGDDQSRPVRLKRPKKVEGVADHSIS